MNRYFLLTILLFACFQLHAQWSIDMETGIAIQGDNDVRIPNDTGTTFNFNGDFEPEGVVIPFRIKLRYTFNTVNHISVLFAPLAINYEGPAPFDIRFQHTLFEKDQFVEGFYKFNSYRVGYRRDFYKKDNWTLGAGFTAKIRDARVQLTTGDLSDKKDDLGFVPLLNIYISYQTENFALWIDGDGLAGGPGRAFDIFAGGRLPLWEDRLHLKAGYRFLEGGADVSDVYNFTLVNFGVLGLIWQI